MAYMCLACSEVYDDYFEKCPKVKCNGCTEDDAVIYVEDVFAPVVSLLNKKGYEIEKCSFGNPNNNLTGQPYIVLHEYLYEECGADELKELFSDLPEPWKLIDNNGYPTITCYIVDKGDKVVHFCKLLEAHIALAHFVEELPELW